MEVDPGGAGGDAVRRPRGFGRALAELFRELGYDEGALDADMFEWLFGLPSLRVQAFLDWFLSSIRARQSVKRQLGGVQDYAIYKTLLARKTAGILTGDELLRAELACQSDLARQKRGADKDESLDSLERTNASLEREVAAMETKLRLANERNERLTRLAQRHSAIVDQQTQRLQRQQDREQFSEILAQITPGNRRECVEKALTPEQLLDRIEATLRHLATPAPTLATSGDALIPTSQHRSLVATPSTGMTMPACSSSPSALSLGDQSRRWRDFLYQHSMEPLQIQEENNLRSLQAKIPAISALTSTTPSIQSSGDTSQEANGSRDVSMSPAPTSVHPCHDMPLQSPWLHESDPTQLNMREQDTMLYNKCCVELERLRKAFVVGEQDALVAQLQVTRYESQLRQLMSSRRQLLQQFQLMSRDAIWARKQILQASVDKTKKQLGELFQRALPQKLDELAFLKSTSILLHSYEQKLWRQENRFVKLRMLLEGFEMQHARLRLVHRLLDAERQDLLQIDTIFQQLLTIVHDHNQRAEQRINSYDTTTGTDAARNTLAQTYLPEQDDVAHRLFEILDRHVHQGDHQELANPTLRLRTFDDLVRLGELKCSNELSLQETTARLYDEFKRLYDSKRFTLDQLRNELFGDATSSTPMLLPVELEATLRKATTTKDAAELGLEKALETLRLHRRSLQVDPSKRMQHERDISRLQHELHERL